MAPTDAISQTYPIYEHDSSIITHLIPQLPNSTSLLRRIQHGLSYPSPTAKILATFPPSGSTSGSESKSPPEPETPWLAARVDLSRGRETQIFLYSSLEKTHASIAPIVPVTQSDGIDSTTTTTATAAASNESIVVSTFTAEPALLEQVRNQFLSLLVHVKKHLLPEYLSSLNLHSSSSAEATSVPKPKTLDQDGTNGNGNGVPLIPPPPPQAFLIGSLHTALYGLLMRSGVYTHTGKSADADPLPGLRIHRFDYPPYYKYFFRRAVFDAEGEGEGGDVSLPSGYRFHDRSGRTGVLDCHLDLVQSRTHIPRSRAQLSSMPGVAVYYDGDPDSDEDKGQRSTEKDENEEEKPIAWGFLGLDGALATLHVEPAHRGKGLALPLCRQIMRRGMASGVFGAEGLPFPLPGGEREKGGEWVHTEVAQYNRASRRVMEKIGGEVLGTVIWTVIEVCD